MLPNESIPNSQLQLRRKWIPSIDFANVAAVVIVPTAVSIVGSWGWQLTPSALSARQRALEPEVRAQERRPDRMVFLVERQVTATVRDIHLGRCGGP